MVSLHEIKCLKAGKELLKDCMGNTRRYLANDGQERIMDQHARVSEVSTHAVLV